MGGALNLSRSAAASTPNSSFRHLPKISGVAAVERNVASARVDARLRTISSWRKRMRPASKVCGQRERGESDTREHALHLLHLVCKCLMVLYQGRQTRESSFVYS